MRRSFSLVLVAWIVALALIVVGWKLGVSSAAVPHSMDILQPVLYPIGHEDRLPEVNDGWLA